MVDISSGCVLKGGQQPQNGLKVVVVQTASTADDGDTIALNSVSGVSGISSIIFAKGVQDNSGTVADEPVAWSGTTLTIGGSTDNKIRDILIICI